ncbi:Bax protein [gamma proteobacterium NOR5-3]|nr:Bax protein [gamma proteobacterium NOR5-3]
MLLRYPDRMTDTRYKLLAWLFIAVLIPGGCGGRSGKLPDFAAIEDVGLMKREFYDFLHPVVVCENQRILGQRAELAAIRSALAAGDAPGWFQRRDIKALAEEYELEWSDDDIADIIDRLWLRVDVIPKELALVQAAKESGWGRSRFAVEYSNLFGHWCYEAGCGVVPERRAAGAGHEVAAFDDVSESVRRYMNNLNTHERYAELRRLRAAQRRAEKPVTGPTLAPGLLGYSERGEPYVEEVISMMQQNQDLLDDAANS